MIDIEKQPPHSTEAEQSVLGGMLYDNAAWDRVADKLAEGDFYHAAHRLLWRAMAALSSRGQPFDVVTLADALRRRDQLDQAGGIADIATLAKNTPSCANIEAYAKIVRDNAVLRGLISAGSDIHALAYTDGEPLEKLDKAQTLVGALAETNIRNEPRLVGALIPGVMAQIDEAHQRGTGITGLPTGLSDLDKITSGLKPSDLIILAARPSMGKTSMAMNIAEYAAVDLHLPVLVFSMEMDSSSVVKRLKSSLTGISLQRILSGQLMDGEWPRLTAAAGTLGGARLLIDDSAALPIGEIRARARRAKREHGLALIVVDYLQLMAGDGENETHRIGKISHGLKALAKELSVPVLALSQLNRGLENRPNKRPIMSDLRQSGDIEQDADLILFIYRDEVYNPGSPATGTAEIIIGKHRNGPLGMVRATFRGEVCRFENYIGQPITAHIVPMKRRTKGFNAGEF